MRADRAGRFLKSKIKNLTTLIKVISKLRNQGRKIVFTNGCFDLLHYGHVKYLEDAKKKGDILLVAVNSDTSVRKIKGNKRPIVNEKDRLSLIAALESVDYAVLFNDATPIEVIKKVKPDILIKGTDWNKKDMIGADFVLGYGGQVTTIKLVKGRSTTNLINKIAKIF